MKIIKIAIVAGARPNFIKIAPLIHELKKHKQIKITIIHTGQHYDKNLSTKFFNELNIPKPDINLHVGSDTHAKQTAKIMEKFEDVILKIKPDLLVVVGDVNSTLACALVASKLDIKIAHVEAGLRSNDRTMPEEINRVLTDQISDYLFITEPSAKENLLKEGIEKNKIFFVGNIMIDTLIANLKELHSKSNILKKINISPNNYALFTLHRPSNVNKATELKKILEIINQVQKKIQIVFPIHPRTKNNLEKFNLLKQIEKMQNVTTSEPLGYFDFLNLMKNSKFILTDSGGIQEESAYLGIPCLTMRQNTERPITIQCGANILVGNNCKKIINQIDQILKKQKKQKKHLLKLWDGNVSKRITNILLK